MKKTLLSVLAGLTVIGSAFADGPSVEDRKKLCQLLIDKGTHVWVEKTSACIPVNPCLSDDKQIKEAYCIQDFTTTNAKIPSNDIIFKVIKEYMRIRGVDVLSNYKFINHEGGQVDFIAVNTTDGDYRVFPYHYKEFTIEQLDYDWQVIPIASVIFSQTSADLETFDGLRDEQKCQEISNFISSIAPNVSAKIDKNLGICKVETRESY